MNLILFSYLLCRHAGVYTSEEAMQVTRDKLIRLQSLYIEQFRRLQHVLRERRRKYLHSLKREKESLCKQPQKYFNTYNCNLMLLAQNFILVLLVGHI